MRTVYVVSTTVSTKGLPSVFLPSGLYAIPESDTTWLMGWSQPDDPVGFDFRPASQTRFTDLMWPELVAHLPAFDSLRVERSWAGLYDVNTLDGNAIVGEWPLIRGLYLASGFSGHGFQQGPRSGVISLSRSWADPTSSTCRVSDRSESSTRIRCSSTAGRLI